MTQKQVVPYAQLLLGLGALCVLVGGLVAADGGLLAWYLPVALGALIAVVWLFRQPEKLARFNALAQDGKRKLIAMLALVVGIALIADILADQLKGLGAGI